MDDKTLKRFWSKVDKTGSCWNWTAYKLKDGYGQFGYNGFLWRSNRFSYLIHFGDPGQKLVCHTCDNPSCVKPDHLFLGTIQDNCDDKILKDRDAKGITNGMSKFTEQEVLSIRQEVKNTTQRALAKKYNVHPCTIRYVVKQGWKHL